MGIHLRHIVGLFAWIHYTNDQNNEKKKFRIILEARISVRTLCVYVSASNSFDTKLFFFLLSSVEFRYTSAFTMSEQS